MRATRGHISFKEALRQTIATRHAFQTGPPYSASRVARASQFLYQDGVLCYLADGTIRMLKIHESAQEEQVIDVKNLLARTFALDLDQTHGSVSLLAYNDGVLACLYDPAPNLNNAWLLALNVMSSQPHGVSVLVARELYTTSCLVVRLNNSYLYYGTHTGFSGAHSHREWVFTGLNLLENTEMPPKRLNHFVGSDIGREVCFEIHNGHFYALSNLTSFEVEEIDWTSWYHCIRFPLEDPSAMQRNDMIWRRQHAEGPINDLWTKLSLQVDERTNKMNIVETRREWTGGNSRSQRTFYTQPVAFELGDTTYITGCIDLPDDILTTQLDETNKPNYAPPEYREPQNFHKEVNQPRDFIVVRTPYQHYYTSLSTSLDIVNDRIPCSSMRWLDRLCLRISSRRQLSPLDSEGALKHEEAFRDLGVVFWPPEDDKAQKIPPASSEAFEPLAHLEAVSDERSIVCRLPAASKSSKKETPIVLISFDPKIKLSQQEINAKGVTIDLLGLLMEPPAEQLVDPSDDSMISSYFDFESFYKTNDYMTEPLVKTEKAEYLKMGESFRF
jgi:hypothetical protein